MHALFDALGDPARIAVVEELARRDRQTLFELCSRLVVDRGLGMSRQAIARHIAVLRDAGLVEVSSIGRTSVHSLNHEALRRGRDWLDTLKETQ